MFRIWEGTNSTKYSTRLNRGSRGNYAVCWWASEERPGDKLFMIISCAYISLVLSADILLCFVTEKGKT